MARLKVPVPPGCIVTADSCTDFLSTFPVSPDTELGKNLKVELNRHVHHIERSTGCVFANPGGVDSKKDKKVSNPLLLSVRVSTSAIVHGTMLLVLCCHAHE